MYFAGRLPIILPQTLYILWSTAAVWRYQTLRYIFCSIIWHVPIRQNCYFLPVYNKIIYRAKIKKKNFERRFLETRKTNKSFFLSRISQLWLYFGKTYLAHFVGHTTNEVPTNVIFWISISISCKKFKCQKKKKFWKNFWILRISSTIMKSKLKKSRLWGPVW